VLEKHALDQQELLPSFVKPAFPSQELRELLSRTYRCKLNAIYSAQHVSCLKDTKALKIVF